MTQLMVIDTEVARREDGLLLTLHFNDGHVEELYVSAAEAKAIKQQLDDALSLTSRAEPT